jgi:hypothetical protein
VCQPEERINYFILGRLSFYLQFPAFFNLHYSVPVTLCSGRMQWTV